MSKSRFDVYFAGQSDEFVCNNGLVPMNDEEAASELLAMNSAIPLSLIWQDNDDNEKYLAWDSEIQGHLQHLGNLIEHGGRESFEQFSIYQSMGLSFQNGFAINQGSIGTCCMCAATHATLQTSLAISKLHGGIKPVELNLSIPYSSARGSGKLSWGSGLNLSGMSQWTSRIGNYLVSDVGKYNVKGSEVTEENRLKFASNALKHQTIPCYVPDISFDTFYEIARAGVACNIGSSSWPSGSTVDSNGMSIGQGASNGGHATCLGGFAIEINRTKYILWTNSHGPKYKVGTRIKQSPFGCFMTKDNWGLLRIDKKYGTPYMCWSEVSLGNK